jgi:hypothetical protein
MASFNQATYYLLMNSKKFRLLGVLALALGIGMMTAGSARAATVTTGYLTCQEAGGWGYIIGGSYKLHCTYSTKDGSRTEYYTGKISDFGADIGYLKSAIILWAVAAGTKDLKPGALAGSYGGVQGSVSLGMGGGVNVLVGGFDKSITLQPLSVEGQKGLNVAAGVGAMTLNYEGEKIPR